MKYISTNITELILPQHYRNEIGHIRLFRHDRLVIMNNIMREKELNVLLQYNASCLQSKIWSLNRTYKQFV